MTAIIDSKPSVSEKTEEGYNYIRSSCTTGGFEVILTTHCNGEDVAWITYNGEQLDTLIDMLCREREKITQTEKSEGWMP